MEKSFNSFLGTGWSFPPAFDVETGGVDMVSDIEDINQSLQIGVTHHNAERPLA